MDKTCESCRHQKPDQDTAWGHVEICTHPRSDFFMMLLPDLNTCGEWQEKPNDR